jgi:hypothetical protein
LNFTSSGNVGQGFLLLPYSGEKNSYIFLLALITNNMGLRKFIFCNKLFHVAQQISLRPARIQKILEYLAQTPGTSTDTTRPIGGSSGSDVALSQLFESKKSKPPVS